MFSVVDILFYYFIWPPLFDPTNEDDLDQGVENGHWRAEERDVQTKPSAWARPVRTRH